MRHQIEEEFVGLELGDKRLNRRVSEVAVSWMEGGGLSFPKMMGSWAALKGAYRLMNHPSVEYQAILKSHEGESVRRAQAHRCVYVIHDTSEFKLSGEKRRTGLGRLRSKQDGAGGFYGHVSLCVSESGVPLGVVGVSHIVRKGEPLGKRTRKALSEDTKRESQRWGKQALQSQRKLKSAQTEVVHVMDREGDSYALYSQLTQEGLRFVIRAAHNRLVLGEHEESQRLFDRVQKSECFFEREVFVSAKKSNTDAPPSKRTARESRMATLSVKACTVTVKQSQVAQENKVTATQPFVTMNVVSVEEKSPPAGVKPVRWVLLTSEPIDSAAAIGRIIDIYRNRWLIEEYFKAIKTGCAYEQKQLATAHALLIAFSICAVVAWQMLLLRHHQRFEKPAKEILTKEQLEVLLAKHPDSHFTQETLPSSQALTWIAALGGHLKHNGPPGWLTLYKGFSTLITFTQGFQFAKQHFVYNG